MNVEEMTEELNNWPRDVRVTVEGDGDVLSFESDGHGGLLIVCGDTEERRDYGSTEEQEEIQW